MIQKESCADDPIEAMREIYQFNQATVVSTMFRRNHCFALNPPVSSVRNVHEIEDHAVGRSS
jgi:hypothetical protein